MKTILTARLLTTVAAATLTGGAALAQPMPAFSSSQPPKTAAAPVYDPQQLPAIHGIVAHYTLTPRGDADGLVLTDGTEVHVPPGLSSQLVFVARPGDAVTVHGLKALNMPMVAAMSVTNDKTGQSMAGSVVDNGPGRAPGPHGPGGIPAQTVSMQGKVMAVLHGPRGEVSGAMLEDGTVLRLPPPEATRFGSFLKAGTTIAVQGDGRTTPLGSVVAVRAIGPTPDQLSQVQAPPRPPHHGRRHGPPGPDSL